MVVVSLFKIENINKNTNHNLYLFDFDQQKSSIKKHYSLNFFILVYWEKLKISLETIFYSIYFKYISSKFWINKKHRQCFMHSNSQIYTVIIIMMGKL